MKLLVKTLGALLVCVLVAALAGAQTTPNNDVLGSHDLSSGKSPVRGPNANACVYCHAPHNADSNSLTVDKR